MNKNYLLGKWVERMSRKFTEKIQMSDGYVKRPKLIVVWELGSVLSILAKITSVGRGVETWALLYNADGSVNWNTYWGNWELTLKDKNVNYSCNWQSWSLVSMLEKSTRRPVQECLL